MRRINISLEHKLVRDKIQELYKIRLSNRSTSIHVV